VEELEQFTAGIAYPFARAWSKSFTRLSPVTTPGGILRVDDMVERLSIVSLVVSQLPSSTNQRFTQITGGNGVLIIDNNTPNNTNKTSATSIELPLQMPGV
jgi:hypothetical protein